MSKTNIKTIIARRRWANAYAHTIEIEVTLRYGARSLVVATIPENDFRDSTAIDQCIAFLNSHLHQRLKGKSAEDQRSNDQILVDIRDQQIDTQYMPQIIGALSKALLTAAADTEKLPLWQYLGTFQGGNSDEALPLPSIAIGLPPAQLTHMPLISDLSIVPIGATSFIEALDWAHRVVWEIKNQDTDRGSNDEITLGTCTRAIEQAGLRPMEDVGLSLLVRTSREHAEEHSATGNLGATFSTDALSGQLVDWTAKHPIISIEDPFTSDELEGFARLTWAIGKRVQIVGNRAFSGDIAKIKQKMETKISNALVIDGDNTRTISEIMQLRTLADTRAFNTILSSCSHKTASGSAIDFAVGWGIKQIQVSGPASVNGIAMCNSGLRILEQIYQMGTGNGLPDGSLPARSSFPWRAFK